MTRLRQNPVKPQNPSFFIQRSHSWSVWLACLMLALLVGFGQSAQALYLDTDNLVQEHRDPYLLQYQFGLYDDAGHAIRTAPLEDFEIQCYEDGVPINMDETGAHLTKGVAQVFKCALVLDYSRSMYETAGAIAAMENAAKTFIADLHEDAQVALFEFHRHDKAPNRICSFISDKDTLYNYIDSISSQYVEGIHLGSRCWDSIYQALGEFGETNPTNEQRYLVALTDGWDHSSTYGEEDIITLAAPDMADVRIFPMGFQTATYGDPNFIRLQYVANNTNGTYYSADALNDFTDNFNQIIEDLDGQYILRWQTMRRSGTFQPSFIISLYGKKVYSPTLNAFNADEETVQGDIMKGVLRRIKPAGPNDDMVIRADYIPPFVNTFRFWVKTDADYSVKVVNPYNGGIPVDWTLTEHTVPEDSGTIYELSADKQLGVAAFGALLAFCSEDSETTLSFEAVHVDNTIYSGTSEIVFSWGEGDEDDPDAGYLDLAPSTDKLDVLGFGVADRWQVGTHPRMLADVNGDGKDDIVGFGDKGVMVSRSKLSSTRDRIGYETVIASNNFSVNPGWTIEGEWEFGVPQGQGGSQVSLSNPDPISGYTGSNVYGVALDGDFTRNSGGPYYLTAGPFDCSDFANVTLAYWRWLNTEEYDYSPCMIEVSDQGDSGWQAVWTTRDVYSGVVNDASWTLHEVDISNAADGKSQVWIRWGYTVTAQSLPNSCWNIDDFALIGESPNPVGDWETPALDVADFGRSQGWMSDRHFRFMADINGDNNADILGFGDKGVYAALSYGDRFGSSGLWIRNFGYNDFWRLDRHPRMMADVNGDGLQDLVGFGDKGVFVSRSWASRFESPGMWVNGFGAQLGWDVEMNPRYMADVNGDGRDDVVGFSDRYVEVATAGTNGFYEPLIWAKNFCYAQGWYGSRHPRFLVDVGGPLSGSNRPMADIVGFGDAGVWVALSNGLGFNSASLWISNQFGSAPAGGYWSSARHLRTVADLNSDGYKDVLGLGDGNIADLGGGDTLMSYSDGYTAFSSPVFSTLDLGYKDGWRNYEHPRLVGDVNGDGIDDIVAFGYQGVMVEEN